LQVPSSVGFTLAAAAAIVAHAWMTEEAIQFVGRISARIPFGQLWTLLIMRVLMAHRQWTILQAETAAAIAAAAAAMATAVLCFSL